MRTASMVCNIIGLVLLFPSVLCSTICAGAVGASGAEANDSGTQAFAAISLIVTWGPSFGLVGSVMGFVGLKKPKTGVAYAGGGLMVLTSMLNFYQLVGGMNLMAVVVGLLYLLAGIFLMVNNDPGANAVAA